jgi:hypothetical protein
VKQQKKRTVQTMERMKRQFLDSHRTFKPFIIEQGENESTRDFSRRAEAIYNQLVNEHENPSSGNRVYMNYEIRDLSKLY